MKALVYHRFGGSEVLGFETLADPVPGEGELLIAVEAVALNPIDIKIRSGAMGPLVNKRFPKIPGADFAGRVAATGAGVQGFALGQRVFGARDVFAGGALAARLVVKARQVAPIPDGLDSETAAALPIAGCAALTALRLLKSPRGARVLLHGASGGVGLFAIQLAKRQGAHVTAICGGDAVDLCRALGADTVIDYRAGPLQLDPGFDLIVNASGRLPWAQGRDLLAPDGQLVEPSPTIPVFIGSLLANLMRRRKHRMLQTVASTADLGELAVLAAANALRVEIAAAYPFDQAIRAYQALETGSTRGKRVVRLGASAGTA